MVNNIRKLYCTQIQAALILMNREKYIDLYTHTLKVKWPIDKCFHTMASKIFKSKG